MGEEGCRFPEDSGRMSRIAAEGAANPRRTHSKRAHCPQCITADHWRNPYDGQLPTVTSVAVRALVSPDALLRGSRALCNSHLGRPLKPIRCRETDGTRSKGCIGEEG